MRSDWIEAIERLARVIWRRKTFPAILLSAGVACLVGAAGGFDFLFRVVASGDSAAGVAEVGSADVPPYIRSALLVIGVGLVLIAVFTGCMSWRAERVQAARTVLVTIEMRSLRLGNDTPLAKAASLPRGVRRDPRVIDIRERLRDGQVHDPEGAVEDVDSRLWLIPGELSSRADDVTLVFGGLAAVPLVFLAGVHLDDEGAVRRLDWSRDQEAWRALDADDDGDRFTVVEHPATEGTEELLLCVSVSYPIDAATARAALPNAALIEMKLDELHVENHWPEVKQRALARQFLEVLTNNSHYRRIRLHLASQASIAFLFGQRYDKRNLPPVLVYQYERGESDPYPWAVQMPVAGATRARVVRREEMDAAAYGLPPVS